MLFILFAVFVGHIGAMDSDKGTAEEQLQKLIEEKLPVELHLFTLEIKIGQLLEAPFPEKPSMEFITSYLSLIAQFSKKYKKEYLNKFLKQWYLKYGKELKLSDWIKKHFPGQTPEQVLYYGFSIQDYLNSPALKNKMPQIKTIGWRTKSLHLNDMKINNLYGLQNIPNIGTVQRLGLSDNQLTTIQPNAFAGLPKLGALFLGNNQLKDIPTNAFADLTNLKLLRLQGNQLTTIQPKAFAGLTNLTHLDLANNQLKDIPTNAFAGLTNLIYLLLSGNQLTTIQPDAFAGLTKLKNLHIGKNQLNAQEQKAIKKALPGVVRLR